jgi:hypothetical protein
MNQSTSSSTSCIQGGEFSAAASRPSTHPQSAVVAIPPKIYSQVRISSGLVDRIQRVGMGGQFVSQVRVVTDVGDGKLATDMVAAGCQPANTIENP